MCKTGGFTHFSLIFAEICVETAFPHIYSVFWMKSVEKGPICTDFRSGGAEPWAKMIIFVYYEESLHRDIRVPDECE
jgi:hypothetical protein